jgi:hypothetical protein
MNLKWVKCKKGHTLYSDLLSSDVHMVNRIWLSGGELRNNYKGIVKKRKKFANGSADITYRVSDGSNTLIAIFDKLDDAKKYLETLAKLTQ